MVRTPKQTSPSIAQNVDRVGRRLSNPRVWMFEQRLEVPGVARVSRELERGDHLENEIRVGIVERHHQRLYGSVAFGALEARGGGSANARVGIVHEQFGEAVQRLAFRFDLDGSKQTDFRIRIVEPGQQLVGFEFGLSRGPAIEIVIVAYCSNLAGSN